MKDNKPLYSMRHPIYAVKFSLLDKFIFWFRNLFFRPKLSKDAITKLDRSKLKS